MVAASFLMPEHPANRSLASEIAQKLVRVRVGEADTTIVTPVLYPGGRMVSVRLLGGPDRFTVTDDGGGMSEAEMVGAEDLYRDEARKVAERYQLRFNRWELFEIDAPLDRLPGFIAIVANAAAEAMLRTTDALTKRLERHKREALADRLERIFGSKQVEKRPVIHGSSTKEWRFEAAVNQINGRRSLFTLITPAPGSVAWGYAKMDDVSRIESAPLITAVIDGRLAADDRVLIGRAARRLLSVDDADDAFRVAA
ncbi:hypothetical protein [Methylobacterium sp. J-068]|uniref:hypothetical protein n=1 Tax=Methylobacterium sp. J-068 TaxID=2836649 RepID=UPI001FBB4E86|nr:hypothetical protein [Methylobacterium sp. J-068]MCJ2034535.1 hypothetical protein [Methylobacterium sp. J-068]